MYNEKLPETLSTYLSSHPLFVEKYHPRKEHTTFVFKMSDEDKEAVLSPFLKGEYSQVDRKYVDKYFPNNPAHRLYGNRLVFDKHPAKRSYWEAKIGQTLPADAEVWPKPHPKTEVYGFINDSNVTPSVMGMGEKEEDLNLPNDSDLYEALA